MIKPITCQDRKNILALLKETGVFNQSEIAVAMELVELVLAKKDNGDYQTFS